MKKILGSLLRLMLFGVFIIVGIMVVRTLGFSSRQIVIPPVEATAMPARAAEHLAQAINQPTVSLDSEIDTLAFRNLDTFFRQSYPLVDSFLETIPIVPYSKVYKWPGKNAKLTPILLMAHQDVVPVEEATRNKWSKEAFSGQKADQQIWGRGAIDDKGAIIAILESIEQLLGEGYVPERTIYLSFGHDEEIGGYNGAQKVATYFKNKGIAFDYILDEGLMILEKALPGLDAPLAMIGIAEKGYLTLRLEAQLNEGGHSSMPPAESAIGILGKAIKRLEDQPFPGEIAGATGLLFDYIGPEMPALPRAVIANRWLTEGLLTHQLSKDPSTSAIIRTTTAPTMIKGGVKDNVMPTRASAQINFRIIPHESIASVIERVKAIVDDSRISIAPMPGIMQDEPSPVSGTSTFGYQVIQKSIQEVFPDVIVAPALTVGLTDSRHFKDLSENIYRFRPFQLKHEDLTTIHGINEKLSEKNLHQAIRFFRQLIKNSCL